MGYRLFTHPWGAQMKFLARAITGAIMSVVAIAATPSFAADLGGPRSPAADHDRVLGTPFQRFHPFSACNVSAGAGMGYGRLTASDQWTGYGNGTGAGKLPLAADGVIAQLGMGCDMHFGRTVVGGYTNYNFGSIGTRIGDTSIDVDRQWGFGGRLGYMATENLLLYTSLGMQWGHAKFTDTSGEMDKSMKGVRFGLGTEYKIMAPVWLRLEGAGVRYEKLDVGTTTVNPIVYSATAAVVFKF
jgi:opacity protein-like surface antigen